ncbi:helix-turn-helix domain-containing protein [Aerococcaceae bacterium zg-B36]|uniref:helix-turn-helix domain-containing protein n=1 Tax=Aerococcaceae bacterium zg-252 TaxID=2796928 RepID=UPI001BD8EE74|nr:helix-turn-helix domain-containing protein [Aerococcaceae bacterium zg-B36]
MIHQILFNNLPTFIKQPETPYPQLPYIYTDDDFMPFTKLNDPANLFDFSTILAGAGLPSDAQLALLIHELTEPTHLHYHDYIEVCYVAKGRLLHILGHEPIIINEGSLCIIPKNRQHLLAPLEQAVPLVINILIHSDLFHKINQLSQPLTILESDNNLLTAITLSDISAEVSFQNFITNYIQHNFNNHLSVIASLIQFLSQLQDLNHQTNSFSHSSLTANCLQLIQANPATVTQTYLADTLNFSPSYLSRYIKKATGKTISELISEEKLRLAQNLLTTTSHSITDIAYQVGYSSESHFFRLFKQRYGITPKHYRNLMSK